MSCRLPPQSAYAGLISLILSVCIPPAMSQEAVEFDATFLRGGSQRGLDVSRFAHDNPVPPGEYESDIFVNDVWKGKSRLRFREHGEKGISTLCMTNTVLGILDLDPAALASGNSTDDQRHCIPATEAIPKATIKYRLNVFRLDVAIAQAYTKARPRDYISPHNWQSGVPSVFLNYDYNFYQTTATGLNRKNNSHFLNLNGGINLGNWHFRHQGSLNWGTTTQYDDDRRTRYSTYANYLQRDIPTLKSQIMLGDFTSYGSLFDTMSLRGFQLYSDDRMLPDSMRGFAPTVRGVAQSNARITIMQNANIIYERTVPPGPFEISDLYPSSYGGDLQVTVNEADGAARTFTVPFNTLSQLVRPGQLKYQIAAGRFRFGSTTLDDKIWQASLQYGISNWLSLNAGVNVTRRYRATLLGGAFNTPLGAFGLDVISSRSTLLNGQKKSGLNWRASYNHFFVRTKTDFSVTTTRYAPKGYYSIQNAILQGSQNILTRPNRYLLDRQKSQLQLTLNQPFAEGWGSAYLTVYANEYWNRRGRNTTVQAGYSNSYKKLSYTLSFSRSRDYYTGENTSSVFLNFSIPLGKSGQSYLTTQAGHTSRGETYASSMLSGVAGSDNAYTYSLSASHDSSGASGSANSSYRTSFGSVNVSASAGKGYRQIGASASGAVIAHPKGISFSEKVGDTFAIISAPGAQGARVTSGTNARLDADGLAIVSYLNPYHINTVGIDPQGASKNVDFDATSNQVIPRANSAMLVELKTRTGAGVLFQVTLPDGSFPPLGADVLDEKGNVLGFVAQQGYVFTRGPKPSGRLQIRWGSADRDRCEAPYTLEPATLSSHQASDAFVREKILCQ